MATTEAHPIAPRRRLSAAKRREALLEAALVVFAERGYHSCSIEHVAQAAGISKSLVYEHFSSKEEMRVTLLQRHAGEMLERLARSTQGVERGGPQLVAGIDAFLGFVEDNRAAWRLLFREAADPRVAATLERITAQLTQAVAALIAEHPAAWSGDDPPARRDQGIQMVAQLLVGSLESLANWWDDHREVPRERLLEVTMGFCWLGLDRLRAGQRWVAPPAPSA